jgi:protein SCO1/2
MSSNPSLVPRRAALAFVLGLCVWLLAATPASAQQWPGVSGGSPAPESADRFGPVPEFQFVEAGGRTVSRADLLGAPWIAVPFFVKCTGPCPSITTDLRKRLHDALAGTPVRIVSFSLDPTLDTPAELAEYRKQREIDADRWWFLTAEDEERMHEFLVEGLKVPAQRAEGDVEYGQSITHGTRMPVIDGEGRIAGWYELSAPAIIAAAGDPERATEAVELQYALVEARLRALAGLPYQRPGGHGSPLPLVNACLNGLATVLLLLGLRAIRGGQRERHEHLMKAAFAASAAFLVSYLYYHGVVQRQYGPTRFNGEGALKVAYYVLLVSHVVLAIVNLPMVLRTFWLAHRERWDAHRRLARWTFPLWLYVSVTGVIVYLVLYPLNPAP